jgi:hypothetical protein
VEEKLKIATEVYPDLSTFTMNELSGSTYISLDDAVALQEYTYNQTPINLSIRNESNPNEILEAKLFDPPWPLKVIRVHPYNTHGEKFTGVPIQEKALLFGVTLPVSSVWTTCGQFSPNVCPPTQTPRDIYSP